jgi:hypothetical protein
MSNSTTKTISMSYSEYEADLSKSNLEGYSQAMSIVRHVLNGKTVKRGEGTTDEEWAIWAQLMEKVKNEKDT